MDVHPTLFYFAILGVFVFILCFKCVDGTFKKSTLITFFVILNITLFYIFFLVFTSENNYKDLMTNHTKLTKPTDAMTVKENENLFVKGKLEGASLLKDKVFNIESNSVGLMKQVKELYSASYECGTAKHNRTCYELLWRVKSNNYQYSESATINDVPIAEDLLEEIMIATTSNRLNAEHLQYDDLSAFDSRNFFIRNGSLYFTKDRNETHVGDLKVNFYSLPEKNITFFATMKNGKLNVFYDDSLVRNAFTYERLYSDNIVSINHFLSTSKADEMTRLYWMIGLAFFSLVKVIFRFVNEHLGIAPLFISILATIVNVFLLVFPFSI